LEDKIYNNSKGVDRKNENESKCFKDDSIKCKYANVCKMVHEESLEKRRKIKRKTGIKRKSHNPSLEKIKEKEPVKITYEDLPDIETIRNKKNNVIKFP
jgi:hypothetical protein